jgi:hypothetical protein
MVKLKKKKTIKKKFVSTWINSLTLQSLTQDWNSLTKKNIKKTLQRSIFKLTLIVALASESNATTGV